MAKLALGFTLLEMLVVLLVMGLLIGLVAVKVHPDERRMLMEEAHRLAQTLQLASEEARLTGKSIRWVAESNRYRFQRAADDLWYDAESDGLLRTREFPRGMTISATYVEQGCDEGIGCISFVPYRPPSLFTLNISFGNDGALLSMSPLGKVHIMPASVR